MSDAAPSLAQAVERLAEFLGSVPLTQRISDLEHALAKADRDGAAIAAEQAGVDAELLRAALVTRASFGRISDLIHAAAIVQVLPSILEVGERMTRRPSLAAGNDPSRPYDLETDRRVAEFKLSQWVGADAMRKRMTFKDLVHLAADRSGRRAQLFVVGEGPIRFLRGSRSSAAWALDRSPATREIFAERFGPLAMSVRDFTAGPGSSVEIVNLDEYLDGGGPVLAEPPTAEE